MTATPPSSSPFHAGELALQRAAGVEDALRRVGPRVIRDAMPEQHREFFAQLPTLFVSSSDDRGRPWASVVAGRPGFVHSPDPRHLRIDALPGRDDPLAGFLRAGADLGFLGLESTTRRRNRVNGSVVGLDARGFEIEVAQSFGNCPKYIQTRTPRWVDETPAVAVQEGVTLSPIAAALVARADTLFIATSADGQGADVSHRGGKPGFVRVEHGGAGTVLTLPDFVGNFFFNTLGNIVARPRAGLLFVDFETGGTLQLTGRAAIVVDPVQVAAFAGGAERLLRIVVEAGVRIEGALPLRWSPPAFEPHLVATGVW